MAGTSSKARATTPAPAPAQTPVAPPAPARSGLFLGRQPILDAQQRMHAFELLFRAGPENEAAIPNNLAATSQVLHYVFAELGIEKALGPYPGFINCDERMLLEPGLLEVLPPDKLVLEILETVPQTPEIVHRCHELKRAGFRLALDDYTGGSVADDLLSITDIVKVDVLAMSEDAVARVVRDLAVRRVTLLAEKVQTQEQAETCKALGFELFQGYYFARPTMIVGNRLRQSQVVLLRVMGMLLQNAETHALENMFKQEPGLSLNLLKIVNSVGTGLRSPVSSIAHAITIVGQRSLLRWIQLLLYSDSGGVGSPLLQLAATRGRLMELLAGDLWPGQASRGDGAFMTGMMSLMPALLRMPLQDILAPLPLPAEVAAALLNREGELGALLEMVERQESHDGAIAFPRLSKGQVSVRLSEAMAWTHEMATPRT